MNDLSWSFYKTIELSNLRRFVNPLISYFDSLMIDLMNKGNIDLTIEYKLF